MNDSPEHNNDAKNGRTFSAFPVAKRAIPALAVVLLISLSSILQVCNMLFGCGCLSPWAGGTMYCDVYLAGAPDCPFCMGGTARQLIIAGIVAIPVVSSVLELARRTRAGILSLAVAGTLIYIAAIVAAGALFAAIDGSDRFGAFFRDLPPPQHPNAR